MGQISAILYDHCNIYLHVWPCASEVSPTCFQAPGSWHEGSDNLQEPNKASEYEK